MLRESQLARDAFKSCSRIQGLRDAAAHHVDRTPSREEGWESRAQAEGQELARPGVQAREDVRRAVRRLLVALVAVVTVAAVVVAAIDILAAHAQVCGRGRDPLLGRCVAPLARVADVAAREDEVVGAQRRDAPRRPAQLRAASRLAPVVNADALRALAARAHGHLTVLHVWKPYSKVADVFELVTVELDLPGAIGGEPLQQPRRCGCAQQEVVALELLLEAVAHEADVLEVDAVASVGGAQAGVIVDVLLADRPPLGALRRLLVAVGHILLRLVVEAAVPAIWRLVIIGAIVAALAFGVRAIGAILVAAFIGSCCLLLAVGLLAVGFI
eukprot:4863346-Prymnesium_polylepis.1